MPRPTRFCPAGIPQHVIQRGNNRAVCFVTNQDFAFYAQCLQRYAETCSVDVHAWVLMSNHVHLLVTPHTENSVSKMMQSLGRCYVRYFNQSHDRTGTLWEGRFKSCLVDSERYLLQCYRYIELNPVTAGMVASPEHYHWSSYQCNALGAQSSILKAHAVYTALGTTPSERQIAYQRLFAKELTSDVIASIRDSARKGTVLGSTKFKKHLQRYYQRDLLPKKVGRPRKEESVGP